MTKKGFSEDAFSIYTSVGGCKTVLRYEFNPFLFPFVYSRFNLLCASEFASP